LVSDGYSSDLSSGNDIALAEKLAADGIVVYAVHIGGGNPPDEIANITGLTGGDVFEAGDMAGISAVFRHIDQLQETRIERTAPEPQDYFMPYCITGLGIGGLALFSLFGLRYTPW